MRKIIKFKERENYLKEVIRYAFRKGWTGNSLLAPADVKKPSAERIESLWWSVVDNDGYNGGITEEDLFFDHRFLNRINLSDEQMVGLVKANDRLGYLVEQLNL